MATTKRKPVRKKTPPRKRPAAKKQRQPIAYRTYATIIAIVSLLAFVLAFGEFGKVGLTLADGGERLIGQFGSLLYGGIGAVLLLLLSNASRAQKWAWSMLLMGSVVWIDLLLGAPRGILNGWLYQNAAYYISSVGAFLIGLFFIGTAVHILNPSFYGELWLGLRERAEEFRNRERTPRPRVEKELKAKPVREKKTKTLRPATVEEPIETEQEAEDPSVNIQDVPIIGFTDHVEPQAAETQGPLT
ncbi:DNA translocase FtsK, partial [Exiguobacterium sp. A1_3_1]